MSLYLLNIIQGCTFFFFSLVCTFFFFKGFCNVFFRQKNVVSRQNLASFSRFLSHENLGCCGKKAVLPFSL